MIGCEKHFEFQGNGKPLSFLVQDLELQALLVINHELFRKQLVFCLQ